MNNKVSNEEFLRRLRLVRGDEYSLVGTYIHSKVRVNLLHCKCNKITPVLPGNATSKRIKTPCKFCNPHSQKDKEIYQYQLNQKYLDEYEVVSEYLTANDPIDVKHKKCGLVHTYEKANGLLQGISHCPYCHKGTNQNTASFKRRLKKLYDNEYVLKSEYYNSRTDISVRHENCGFIYIVTPNELIRGRSLCPVCSDNSKLKTTESVNFELKYKYGDKYTLVDEFKTVNDEHQVKCNSCNQISAMVVAYLLTNNPVKCPICGDGISYPEKFVRNVLDQLKEEYIIQYSRRDAVWVGKYRYDFYLPKHNWIIEVHGLQHYEDAWQSLEVTKQNDQSKEELANNNGVTRYTVIDARKSDGDYIKNSIEESEMILLDLSNVKWEVAEMYANKPYMSDIIELWNNDYEIKQIKTELEISETTIARRLKTANSFGLLSRSYGGGHSRVRSKAAVLRNSKIVKCIETGEVFNSAKEADECYSPQHVSKGNVAACARGKSNMAFGMHWEYI